LNLTYFLGFGVLGAGLLVYSQSQDPSINHQSRLIGQSKSLNPIEIEIIDSIDFEAGQSYWGFR